MKMFDHTVATTSGNAAALTRSMPSGTGITCGAGTTTFSAYPPPASSAQHSSPTDQSVDLGADRGDPAGHLEPDRAGRARRRWVEALPLQQVGAVHTRGDDVDHDLVHGRCRIRDLSDRQNLDTTGTLTNDSSHVSHRTGDHPSRSAHVSTSSPAPGRLRPDEVQVGDESPYRLVAGIPESLERLRPVSSAGTPLRATGHVRHCRAGRLPSWSFEAVDQLGDVSCRHPGQVAAQHHHDRRTPFVQPRSQPCHRPTPRRILLGPLHLAVRRPLRPDDHRR